MKKKGFMLLSIFVIMLLGRTYATDLIDTQLVDKIDEGNQSDANQLKFQQAKSCDTLEDMLKKYAKVIPNTKRMLYMDAMLTNEVKGVGISETSSLNGAQSLGDESLTSSSVEYSKTNIQKEGVDEPELLKTDGKYYYYYNNKTHKIIIVSSPLDIQKSTLSTSRVKIIKEIVIPNNMNNVQLFVSKERLIIMGNYWSRTWGDDYVFNGNRTILGIYKTTDIQNPDLIKFSNLPGYYKDARLIDDNLYIVTEQGLNRYAREKNEINLEKGLSNVEITKNGESVNKLECSNISYVLPEDEKLTLNPKFTIISAVNIKDESKNIETTALLSPSGEIHMTKDSLYLVSHYYTQNQRRCPIGLLCVMPVFRGTTQTLIHKFSRNNLELVYKNTAVAPGYLLNQYSMDEDSNGYFRILTKSWDNDTVTNLYLFDKGLNLIGKLENIEPGEEFKSSRYIGNKLYLVTFEQIDPLFVIDLENPKDPKILGELKIPGYSTYLHPLKNEKGKQYLIGLGYSTAESQWGGIINSGVKLSLFEIDYTKKDNNFISIKELDSLSQGGEGSYSNALNNPRLFVMDSKGNVTLPLNLTNRVEDGEDCSITYDAEGNEKKRYCTPIKKEVNRFIGLKTFNITPEGGIKESFQKNYIEDKTSSSLNLTNNQRYLNDMRVGFAGDALFNFNPLFVDFIFPNANTGATIQFN